MATKLTWQQALGWRMERHLLDPVGKVPVEDVVRRLCGIQAQVASSAELAVRVRQSTAKAAEVGGALRDGRLVKTWAMRGTLHLLTPEDAGPFLSLMGHARSWERPIWERYFGVSPKQMEALRPIVREILGDESFTREELIARVTKRRGFGHIGEALKSGWGTLLKPLAWQGDLVFGPSRGTRVTFMSPHVASTAWAGVPAVDDAWAKVILSYLGAYGPATIDNFSVWLSRGTISKRQLRTWFAELGDQLTQVDVDGESMYVRSADVEALSAARPSSTVRLLAGFDQWVLGPGTDDAHVVPAARRRAVSKQAGWIAPVVIVGGVVRGTWELKADRVSVAWFKEGGNPPKRALQAEVARLSKIVGRDLVATVAEVGR
ncbi:MAG: DNA glycosylase AlkZ-like family protein [Candidatus Limnocylindrales bacterium]